MTQQDRDRLVALKKAKKGLITQRQAAEEIGQSERHVRRLLKRLKGKGDKALVHALRGRPSNRKLEEKTKQKAVEILGREVYHGFGPTLAAEYLASNHDIHAGRETVRSWMIEGKLWRASRQRVDTIHQWRPRRSRVGELVQWDTSEHAWLVERSFQTAQDRLVKGLRVAGAKSLEHANAYLEEEFVVWWNKTIAVVPASSDDAHRALGKEHSLAASLSYVENRQVSDGYTIQFDTQTYRIARSDVRTGLRGADVRIEMRLDASMAVRCGNRYVTVTAC